MLDVVVQFAAGDADPPFKRGDAESAERSKEI